MVELPDTASRSGLSRGSKSTCVVFYFVLAITQVLENETFEQPWLVFELSFAA